MSQQVWYKPSQIVKDKMILDLKGQPNYRFVLRLINSGELPAKVWTVNGKNTENGEKRNQFVVHIDDIRAYNEKA